MRNVKLTKAQIGWVDWALGAMEHYAEEEDCPYTSDAMPYLEGHWLRQDDEGFGRDEAWSDLAERIQMLAELTEDEGEYSPAVTSSQAAAMERFAEKLENV